MEPNWAVHEAFVAATRHLAPLKSNKREAFLDRKSIVIRYKGEALYQLLRFDVRNCKGLTVLFERHEGPWRQGLHIEVNKGKMDIEGEAGRRWHLWTDTAPPEMPVRFVGNPRMFHIWNIWGEGRREILGMINCAAIRLERLPDGMRLHCNDGYPDEDFTDLVVRLRFTQEDGGVPPLIIPQVEAEPASEGESKPSG